MHRNKRSTNYYVEQTLEEIEKNLSAIQSLNNEKQIAYQGYGKRNTQFLIFHSLNKNDVLHIRDTQYVV